MNPIKIKGIHSRDFSLWEFDCYPVKLASSMPDEFYIEPVTREMQHEIRAALPESYLTSARMGGGTATDGVCLRRNNENTPNIEIEKVYIEPNSLNVCEVPMLFGSVEVFSVGKLPNRKNKWLETHFMRMPSHVELPETHFHNYTDTGGKRYRIMRVIAE